MASKQVNNNPHGVVECLLASFVFFSPNILLIFPLFRNIFLVLTAYNFIVIYLLVSTVTKLKFNND